jgi:hypothetical protein
VASALKWGFADFEISASMRTGKTLSPEDLAKVMDLLRFRPMQFFAFF